MPAPADRLALGGRERLGDEDVVVDRGDVAADLAQQRPRGAGREQGAARRGPCPRRRRPRRRRAARAAPSPRLLLVDADAGRAAPPPAGRGRACRGRRSRCRCGPRRRRGRSGSRPRPASPRRRGPRPGGRSGAAARPPPRGRRPRAAPARRRSRRVSSKSQSIPWRSQVGAQAGEVLQPQPLQRLQLVGEAREPVAEAVGQRGLDEAAVAAAGGAADPLGLEQEDVAAGVVGLRLQRRPEPGEAAADDAEVGLGAAAQGGRRLARRQRRDPVGRPLGLPRNGRGRRRWEGCRARAGRSDQRYRRARLRPGPVTTLPGGMAAEIEIHDATPEDAETLRGYPSARLLYMDRGPPSPRRPPGGLRRRPRRRSRPATSASHRSARGSSASPPPARPRTAAPSWRTSSSSRRRCAGESAVPWSRTPPAAAPSAGGPSCTSIAASRTLSFYERAGFRAVGTASTQFGPALSLVRALTLAPSPDR